MNIPKNKTFILLVIVLSLLAVTLMFSLGALNVGKYLTKEPAETVPSDTGDESSADEVSFKSSTFDCPQFESLTASEKEELSDKIQKIIQELIESDTQPDNEILITEFPKCFAGSDS